jgi:hypothetical protein
MPATDATPSVLMNHKPQVPRAARTSQLLGFGTESRWDSKTWQNKPTLLGGRHLLKGAQAF